MEQEEKSLKEEIKELKEIVKEDGKKKNKKFKLPFKARLGNRAVRTGYVTVAIIRENKNIDFTKEPIVDLTIKLDGDSFHALEEKDIFFYKNKPFVFQPKSKLNPYNPLGKNETYGQKYIMARMEGDKIITKKKLGLGISIGALIIIGVIAYALIAG